MRLCFPQQMAETDRRAAAEFGMPTLLLMENAGRAVAERALARLASAAPHPGSGKKPHVAVLCGKGNNGGDGFVAARHLHNRGIAVTCYLQADPTEVSGDARVNLDLLAPLAVPVVPLGIRADLPPHADLFIDALLGTGFKGEIRGPVGEAVAAANASGAPILAVDVPSGLDAGSGQVGGGCIRAVETVTFGMPKVGLVIYPGRDYAGEITVANISLPRPLLIEETLRAEWLTAERVCPLWPSRPMSSHKGDAGRLFVLAGSPGLTGAAAMACDAALRAGAGLVTLGIPHGLAPVMAAKLTEAMTLPLPESEAGGHSLASLELLRERLAAAGALAAGPGFGRAPEARELLRAVLADCPVPVAVDADGLTLLAPADGHTFPARCVLTPHPGEMARLLGTEVHDIQSNRLGNAKAAAERFGCVVVLKGAGTVIAAPDGRLAVNSSGGPALASGGTGDVLTGILGACLARGMEPYEAAVAAVFLHGVAGEVAGERFGAPGAVAGDVIAAIPEALRRLHTGELPMPCRMV